ncbi:MAG: hypothetical protein A3F74_21035 [Betaproteobacteria bacterium RIFCSPLOWO2_12_FULL_62_58]|nr:MAG: hypothetical protein A3F74_21035 [Betaproteobacteria bacterium RIFCSPLOWO2_12_FULL_62_58]
MRLRFATGLWLVLTALGVRAAETVVVAPELWDRPRSGQIVLEQPALKQVVKAYLGQPGVRLIVHHAARQESLLHAEELRAWLVALAVEAERIALRASLHAGEPLKIEVVTSQ